MNRRDFVKLSPAFAGAAAATATLTLREEGKEPVDLDVSVLRVKPGDVVVLKADARLPAELVARIKDHFEESFPGLKAMVLDAGLNLEGVLRQS